ncbi:hypothetical protein Tco_0936876 [Tanacetum coccineum]|uniref:Uncharacterized protein n=1 Tax=Tanacetum coccineum TaxID=301880 RepID=A0ABQ5DCR7_9ASTR
MENVHDADMFRVHDLDGDEVFVETERHVVNAATTANTIPVSVAKDLSNIVMTLDQALAELKNAKPKTVTTAATTTTTTVTRPKAKGLAIQEQEQASTPITSSKDKGKAKRAEEKRNKPPTKAQQRSIMTTYLKNMAGWKPKDLKNKSFANVQELFEKAMKRVNTFVDMDTELVEGSEIREEESSKRAGDELEQENAKK